MLHLLHVRLHLLLMMVMDVNLAVVGRVSAAFWGWAWSTWWGASDGAALLAALEERETETGAGPVYILQSVT